MATVVMREKTLVESVRERAAGMSSRQLNSLVDALLGRLLAGGLEPMEREVTEAKASLYASLLLRRG